MNGSPSTHRRARSAGLGALLIVVLLGTALVAESSDYHPLWSAMRARQPHLDAELTSARDCLGERLDGLLEINASCPPDARALAEDENRDREALHAAMARDEKKAASRIGVERAKVYVDRYKRGIMREVAVGEGETTWWDGSPPDPRQTPLTRVLALQGARIHAGADADSAIARDNVQQYEAFGVFDSARDSAGRLWYRVTEEHVPKHKPLGWSPHGLGWLREDESIPWRRAVVMRFTSPLDRERSLFFSKAAPLVALIGEDRETRRARIGELETDLRHAAGAGDVIAVEPRVSPDQERAVIYPVLDFYGSGRDSDLRIDGRSARVLKVAARTRGGGEDSAGGTVGPVDIMFVMDTTESMGPYLKDALNAVEQFAASSKDIGLRFGFIGYRDADPRFEYQALELTERMEAAGAFASTLAAVRAQPVPVAGDDIPESVFEGVNLAIESPQWRPRALRLVFLIGDAPGKDLRFSIDELRRKADVAQVKILAFHIKNTKVSKGLDGTTAQQYRDLTARFQGAYGTSKETAYFHSIDSASKAFGQLLLDRLRQAHADLSLSIDCAAAGRGPECLPSAQPGTLSELIFQHAALTLADASMPRNEILGWVCDKALSNPSLEALAPMVLLTESELDELDARVRELKQVGEDALRGEGGTTVDFFDLVAKNTRMTMVDPSAVRFRDAFAVPLGIDWLPYDSDIMSMTRDEFRNPDRVQSFVASMKAKLAAYEDLRRARSDPGKWKRLSAGATERVVGLELNHLP